jgi:hypothetical protein
MTRLCLCRYPAFSPLDAPQFRLRGRSLDDADRVLDRADPDEVQRGREFPAFGITIEAFDETAWRNGRKMMG